MGLGNVHISQQFKKLLVVVIQSGYVFKELIEMFCLAKENGLQFTFSSGVQSGGFGNRSGGIFPLPIPSAAASESSRGSFACASVF